MELDDLTPQLALKDRTVLVTGASSGLGAHFAEAVAGAGAKVILAARRLALLDDVKDRIEAAGGVAISIVMDTTDEKSVIAGYAQAESAFGTIHSVVANAGTSVSGPSLEQSVDAWDQVMAVNVKGAFLTAREGARRMIAAGSRETGFGRIVLIASITANYVSPGLAAYSASKAAVVQMGRVMAREWVRNGINVNMLCPGYVQTDLNSEWFASEPGLRQIQGFPRRRLMDAKDLDGTLIHLLADGSRAITGTSFTIDDAQSL
jgi:NAD(P)-dependent dehydrogenase (short-subunit alcohol dehydrogenase family)